MAFDEQSDAAGAALLLRCSMLFMPFGEVGKAPLLVLSPLLFCSIVRRVVSGLFESRLSIVPGYIATQIQSGSLRFVM